MLEKVMYHLIVVILALVLGACSMTPDPTRSLKEANVVEGPLIIQRGSDYFLRYRRATSPTDCSLMLPVAYKQVGDAGCYYFYGPVSGFYYGELVEYPLVYDKGATAHARAGSIYWLNPDGIRIKIPIKRDNL